MSLDLNTVSVDSERDYLKIFTDGSTTVSTTGGGDPDADLTASESGSTTITHNLTYVPLVRVAYDPAKNGVWYQSKGDQLNGLLDPWLTVVNTTTTTKLIINAFSSKTNIPIFYRIYELGEKSFTSEQRIDNIFYDNSGSASVAAAASSIAPETTTVSVVAPEQGVPMWVLQFSEDGTTWYNEGTPLVGAPDTSSGPPGGPYTYNYYTTAYGRFTESTNTFSIILRSNYTTTKTLYYRYVLDFRTSNVLFSSEVDAYKHSGEIQTATITLSGSIAMNGTKDVTSTPLQLQDIDFSEIVFDNSDKHSGEWHSLALEGRTFIRETTSASDLVVQLFAVVSGDSIAFRALVVNPYAGSINLTTTIINVRYIPYEATI